MDKFFIGLMVGCLIAVIVLVAFGSIQTDKLDAYGWNGRLLRSNHGYFYEIKIVPLDRVREHCGYFYRIKEDSE